MRREANKMDLLRPALYQQLKVRFHGKVKVSKQGEPIRWSLRTTDGGRSERYFDQAAGDDWGEYYRVCCPACQDTKFRLSINHMWGLPDEACGGNKNLWLMACHRRDCYQGDYERQRWLYEQVFDQTNLGSIGSDNLIRREKGPCKAGELIWPGTIWRIDQLPPDHAARKYLEQTRGFDATWLYENFRVGYVLNALPNLRHLNNQIYIPVFFNGKQVGWQTRHARPKNTPTERMYTTMTSM